MIEEVKMTIFDPTLGYAVDAVRLIDWWFGVCGVDLSKLVAGRCGETPREKDDGETETQGRMTEAEGR